jgi:hypothetical protein
MNTEKQDVLSEQAVDWGPGTDCVTVASHKCTSVDGCIAFGMGTSDGTTFQIELYSCLSTKPQRN